ncbi:MAG: methyltransferase [Bryobacteraceae bacterium]|jgi:(2Fe-2S) ferredoxin/ubiquinone/menaquinone biosynthesis C-methylase UbiE
MEPFRYHIYVCDRQKPEGVPCCPARGSRGMLEELRREIVAQGLENDVQITTCGSLGLCERGPNMVVYPEGVWYSGVRVEDVREIVESHFRQGRPVSRLINTDAAALATEVCANRDRYLASLRARDAAGVMPDELAQTIRGFQESRVILTALELDLFSAIGSGTTAAQVAAAAGTDARATEMLLNALASLELVRKEGPVFHNAPVAARFLAAGSPDSARMAMLHTARLWHRWSGLTECVRTGTAVPDERGPEGTEAFIAAMHNNARMRAAQLAQAAAAGAKRMLDVGGGSGAYAIAFAKANPRLRAEVFDQPAVLAIAERHIHEAGLTERVTTRAGDLRADEFGGGYDLVLISAICHMLAPEENRNLLARAYRALEPGGRVVIQDFLLRADKTGPRAGALFSLNMLVNTRGGASYSEDEYTAWLRAAGFGEVRRVPLAGPAGVLIASRG